MKISLGCEKVVGSGIRLKCSFLQLVIILLLVTVAGCQSYNWLGNIDEFGPAEQRARAENKSLFIYYKWWLDSDSNRMIREVLNSPDVTALFQDSINLLVEMAGGSKYVDYMSKYGISSYPASVVVAPDGAYQVRVGFVPKEEFIEFVRKAKPPRANGAK